MPILGFVRSASLRTRVAIASAVAAAAVVAVFTVATSFVLLNNDVDQVDRRLDAIVAASVDPEPSAVRARGVLTTGRNRATGQVMYQRGFQLPTLPPGSATVQVNGVEYRVRTVAMARLGGVLVSVGIPNEGALLNHARVPTFIAVGAVTVLIAAALGWALAGPAIRPLRRLTEQTKRLGKGRSGITPVKGAREAEELSDAMVDMVSRVAAAQRATNNSLQAAQDFAANAAHELRTPLTAMRADIDTLRIHDLPPEERDEVVGDLARAQRRVEAIITALGQLASGQLARVEDREPIDVADLLDRVARENVRASTADVVVVADEDLGTVQSWPGGLRLAVDNLVRNAITHGLASRITLTAKRIHGQPDWLTIIVDDDGRGLPAEEHQLVLGRFARGSTAAPGGSGLGLALVAQQAELHGGTITLSDGPLGGLRATLSVPVSPEPADAAEPPVSVDAGLLRRHANRVAELRSPQRRRSRS